jgi:hypothetical protein
MTWLSKISFPNQGNGDGQVMLAGMKLRISARSRESTCSTIPLTTVVLHSTSPAVLAAVIIACVALLPQRAGSHPGRDQPLVGGLQARRRNPVVCLCVGLEQLNFPKKFISLWTRRHAVSFTRALLRHTDIINLFHAISPRKQTSPFQRKSERCR